MNIDQAIAEAQMQSAKAGNVVVGLIDAAIARGEIAATKADAIGGKDAEEIKSALAALISCAVIFKTETEAAAKADQGKVDDFLRGRK